MADTSDIADPTDEANPQYLSKESLNELVFDYFEDVEGVENGDV